MSRYAIAAVAAADKKLAQKTMVGGEKTVYVSLEEVTRVGSLFLTGDQTGTYEADPVNALPASGSDLQVALDGPMESTAAAVVTVVGTSATDQLLSGTATFTPPSWVRNRAEYGFAHGVALDIVPSITNALFKTVTSMSVTNAKKGATLRLFTLPAASSWIEIDKVEECGVAVGHQVGHSVPDGMRGTDEVVLGRSGEQTLSITAFKRSTVDKFGKFAGRFCSVKVEVRGSSRIHKETHVYGGFVPNVQSAYSAGPADVMEQVDGPYEDLLMFFAP